MRSRVQFLVLPLGFSLEGEDSHGEYGVGSLVELRYFIFRNATKIFATPGYKPSCQGVINLKCQWSLGRDLFVTIYYTYAMYTRLKCCVTEFVAVVFDTSLQYICL
jgi:hypothetical protein